ncbi:flagellar basal body rod protein FlgB [Comamonas aquatica]|jgi:flagellar basal-body rod protein FlgB|uniref:Flagellar basal body rod protein FlgB n=2 Tax=Comamonas aquatica TaxID=225991 RepID=A0A014MF37_9BURK|nr:flagellar basal body rod protein FlgB [Comamonas aquatica]ANY60821.1 flagellar basal-body rod protein FlgB [Comamonas aquatica]EXU80346.1 flagellar biosynthesis protein FlgB [Comamonas aquatica DA1877]MDE1555443.1 flagellar basal body rod protein FlgB [Comamonas aquatica]MDH0364418.1 flagellar basal body rod protein FlgB [Comamonas aquatica]MDH0383037.1 flagellar basal body rod protein FlgB [Comamonas aquatica]
MLNKMTGRLDFHSDALLLRAERQRVLASNIANADTPGYVARDFNFAKTLQAAQGENGSVRQALQAASTTHSQHMPLPTEKFGTDGKGRLGYSLTSQPSLDNNTVDLDRERANFVDNAVRYEATLRFLNGSAKTMLSAITGQ